MRPSYFAPLLLGGLLFGFQCSVPGVTFEAATDLAVNVSSITSALVNAGLPTESGSSPQRLASICCGASSCAGSSCPAAVSASGYTVDFACLADVCDPSPVEVATPGTAIDLAALSSTYLSSISKITLESIKYTVRENTLTAGLEPIEIYWGSSGATAWNSTGTHRLGTVAAIAAGGTGSDEVVLDRAGLDALNAYLASTAKQIRVFYRTRVDLAPGEPIPGGALDVRAVLRVKATGTLK